MKRFFLLTLCLVAFTMTWAFPVTKQQAKNQARQFLLQRHSLSDEGLVMSDVLQSIHRSQSSNPESQNFYVFNVNCDEGFVIVSADDSTTPILGWCDHGSFDESTIPENMRALLEGYAEEIQFIKSARVEAPKNIDNNPSIPMTVKNAIAPMLTTQWNQGSPL